MDSWSIFFQNVFFSIGENESESIQRPRMDSFRKMWVGSADRQTAGGRSSDGRQRRPCRQRRRKKKSFDRGSPVWPPRSNVTNDRLRGEVWGGFAPRAKIEKNAKIVQKN